MQTRTNEDIIRTLRKWQASGLVHELTCQVESRHEALIPAEREGKVVLVCATCGSVQDVLPETVLASEAWLDALSRQAADTIRIKALERRRPAVDRIWIYGSSAIGASLLGLFWLGPIGAAGGCVIGLIAARLATRKKACCTP